MQRRVVLAVVVPGGVALALGPALALGDVLALADALALGAAMIGGAAAVSRGGELLGVGACVLAVLAAGCARGGSTRSHPPSKVTGLSRVTVLRNVTSRRRCT